MRLRTKQRAKPWAEPVQSTGTSGSLAPMSRSAVSLVGWALLMVSGLASLPAPAVASEVRILKVDTEADFRAGTFDGIGIGSNGGLRLSERAERIAQIEEPFVFDAAAHPDGLVLGTGNAGRVLLVKNDGTVVTLFEVEEAEVYAVAADSEGYVYAASSPDGKVYRFREGNLETWFEPEQKYVWDLAVEADGSLLVATGTDGKLFRVDRSGTGTLVHDDKDTHIRSLLARPDGSALVGTAGEGLVLELRGTRVRTLFDAVHPEVVSFAASPEGSVYAAVLASEASFVSLQPQPSSSSASATDSKDAKVTVEEGAKAAGSRRKGFSGSRSEVLEISSSGAVDVLWRFEKETLFALGWFRDRLWAGSGMGGQLYSYRDRQMTLEKDLEERQIVGLLAGDPGPVLVSTDAGGVYFFSGRAESEGSYLSKSFDAGEPSRFGLLRWTGTQPEGTEARFSVRTGLSAEPDGTWSEWTSVASATANEGTLADLPTGRYAQWKLDLEGADSPRVDSVELSYRQINRRPEITKLDVLAPGQILVPANFNASNQAYEPMTPNREGIFTTLSPARDRKERSKALWKRGYRTLTWTASDPNKDELRYRLELRRPSGSWLELVDELDAEHFSFDSSVLPDGTYEFRLLASDAEDNTAAETMVADRTTEPVTVDQTPPQVVSVRRESGQILVEVRDSLSPLREAQISVNVGKWREVAASDGMLDARSETLRVEVDPDADLAILRISDAAFNSVTIDLLQQLGR